jgi:hypothetical protein
VPDEVIARLQMMADDKGRVRARDVSRLSSVLGWRVGDQFAFKGNGALGGLVGRISALDKLDDKGTIKAWVTMLGGDREVEVSHRAVKRLMPAVRSRQVEALVA